MAVRLRATVVALALACLACTNRSPEHSGDTSAGVQEARSVVLPACPRVVVSTAGWSRVETRDGILALRLPPQHSVLRSGAPESWAFPAGEIGYEVVEQGRRWYDSVSTDRTAASRGWCREEIGGADVLIQYTYASPATGPGYYMQAIWQLDAERELWLAGRVRDTTEAGVLLAIARSVRLHDADGAR